MKIEEIIKFIDDRIEHYQKIIIMNDEEYIKIDDVGLGITGEKMTKQHKKKALAELQNGTIFLQGKIEALQEINKVIKI